MRIFACPHCGATLYFENLRCGCGTEVAWDPEAEAFEVAADTCANRAAIGCNWRAGAGYCRSCAMTEIVPGDVQSSNRPLWAEAERAKRWTLANLGRWGWFKDADEGRRPSFHLLAEDEGTSVQMGHADGLITINVSESDPVERTRRRMQLAERLRTMVAHFRHEIAHFLFERLRDREGFLEEFRDLMGDERADYGAALERHYGQGPPEGWQVEHVTAYASAHPHEDWAESAAHVVHLTDIVDSALAAGLRSDDLTDGDYDAYADEDDARPIRSGAGFGIAMNHVNRAMGLDDAYPFVLTPAIRGKLRFVRRMLRTGAGTAPPPA